MTHVLSATMLKRLALTFAVGMLVSLPLIGSAQAHVAQAARACSTPSYPGSGYFTSLKVYNTSCSTGRSVALAWYHCRVRHGAAGQCTSRVLGFSCREHRVRIPTEYDAKVTCNKGRATVIHTYQQNT